MSEHQHLIQGGSPPHYSGLRPVLAQVEPASHNHHSHTITNQQDNGCLLFEFVLNFILTGSLCLIGLAANTICFVTFWQEQLQSSITFLFQAIFISDLAIIWILFIQEVVPGLGYIIPLLSDCQVVCDKISLVTQPLLMLAQSAMMWLTFSATFNYYLFLNAKPNMSYKATLDLTKKQVLVILICSIILILPLTFDSTITVAHIHMNTNQIYTEQLRDNALYKRIYINGLLYVLTILLPWVCITYVGLKLICIFRSIKRMRRAMVNIHRSENVEMAQGMLTICIVMGVCYFPQIVEGIVKLASHSTQIHCGHLLYYLAKFCNMFKALHSCLKMVVFMLFYPRFSEMVNDTFCRGRQCFTKHKNNRNDRFVGYHCQDMSEMTLMSHIEDRAGNSHM